MIDLQVREGGVCLPVKVQPGARRNAIVGEHAGALKVAVQAAPEQGKATAAVCELLAEQLELPHANIGLLKGATSRQKLFLIRGIELEALERRLVAACPGLARE